MAEGGEKQKLVEPGLLFCEHPGGQSWSPHAPASPAQARRPCSPPAGALLSPSACSTHSCSSTPPGLAPPGGPRVAERGALDSGSDSCGDWMRMPICARSAPIGARSVPPRSGGWWWAAELAAGGGRVWNGGAEDAAHSGPPVGQDGGNGWDEDRQKSCHDWICQVSEKVSKVNNSYRLNGHPTLIYIYIWVFLQHQTHSLELCQNHIPRGRVCACFAHTLRLRVYFVQL